MKRKRLSAPPIKVADALVMSEAIETERKRLAGKSAKPKREPTTITAVHLPRRTFDLLRHVAFKRARRAGGRPSVSAVVVELAEAARERFVREYGDPDAD